METGEGGREREVKGVVGRVKEGGKEGGERREGEREGERDKDSEGRINRET